MTYTKENINYCLLTWDNYTHEHVTSHAGGEVKLTGLFNWKHALDGDYAFPRSDEEWSKYNIVHLNITPNNLPLICKIKQIAPPHVKLVGNVDHAIDLWAQNFKFQHLFMQEINRCDFLFSVEPTMSNLLSHELGRHVPCIPHPVDTEGIKKFRCLSDRAQRLLVSVHRYDKNWLLPYYAVKGFPKFTTSMFGVPPEPPMTQLYDEVLPSPIPFPDLIRTLADSYAMVESYTLKSFGRLTIEAAVLGIPVVGSGCVASQHILFPDLKCTYNDPIQWRARVERLINDREFYRDCAVHAMSHSELYSYSSCRDSLLKLLNAPNA